MTARAGAQLTVLVLAAFVGYRGDLEGADHAAHAADERHQRDPRDRHRGRHPRRGVDRLDAGEGARHIAIVFGAINVAGGFLVTDRMLQMFKRRARGASQTMDRRSGVRPRLPGLRGPVHLRAEAAGPLRARRCGETRWRPRHVRRDRRPRCGTGSPDNSGWILAGMVVGGRSAPTRRARVKMTAMPQMVALFNGVGGGAAALIAFGVPRRTRRPAARLASDEITSILFSAIVGSVSFAGSMIAFGKLQELITGSPVTVPGQKLVNAALFTGGAGAGRSPVRGRRSARACWRSRWCWRWCWA